MNILLSLFRVPICLSSCLHEAKFDWSMSEVRLALLCYTISSYHCLLKVLKNSKNYGRTDFAAVLNYISRANSITTLKGDQKYLHRKSRNISITNLWERRLNFLIFGGIKREKEISAINKSGRLTAVKIPVRDNTVPKTPKLPSASASEVA